MRQRATELNGIDPHERLVCAVILRAALDAKRCAAAEAFLWSFAPGIAAGLLADGRLADVPADPAPGNRSYHRRNADRSIRSVTIIEE